MTHSLSRQFANSVFTLSSAGAFSQLLLVAVSPIVARLYGPESFGQFAIFLGLLSPIVIVSGLRYELAIPLARADLDARRLAILCLLFHVSAAMLLVGVVVVFRFAIASFLNAAQIAPYLWLLPLAVAAVGSYRTFNYWAVRKRAYGQIGLTKLVQSGSNITVQIAGGLFSMGTVALILAHIVGQAIGVLRLAKDAAPLAWLQQNKVLGERSLVLLKKYHRFPKFDVPAAAVDAASAHLPSILLAALFGVDIAGYYLLAERTLLMPASLLGQSIGQVLYGSVAASADLALLHRAAKRLAAVLAGLAILPLSIIGLFGEALFAWVFGENWVVAGEFAEWLIVGVAAQFVFSPLSMVLMATNGQHINFIIHLVLFALKVLAAYIGWMYGSAVFCVIGFAVANLMVYSVTVVIILNRTGRAAQS